MAKKTNKQKIIKKKVTFDTSNIEKAHTINSAYQKKNTPEKAIDINDVTRVRMVLPESHIELFNDLGVSFKNKIKSFAFGSPNLILNAFIEAQYSLVKNETFFKEAPEDFKKHITRKGRRPRGENSDWDQNKEVFFVAVKKDNYNHYLSLLFTHLNTINDVHSRVYSASYYFKYFLDDVKRNMKTIVNYHKE